MQNLNNREEIQALFDVYISECEYTKGLRPETIKSYREVFNTFQKIMPEISQLEDINPGIFNLFFKRLKTRKRHIGNDKFIIGVKQSTIRTYYDKLMVFVRWLEDNKYLEKDQISKRIKKPLSPEYEDEKELSESDIAKLIATITNERIGNTFLLLRDLTILNLFIYTGIRKSELLGLRVGDINFQKKQLLIRSTTSKSKRSRYIPIHITLNSQLKQYLIERKKKGYTSEYLIVSSKDDKVLSSDGLRSWVKKYKENSKVNFHLHQFRHTFACNLARNNAEMMSIMKVLGHSSLKMTQRYLRSISTEEARDYINLLSY